MGKKIKNAWIAVALIAAIFGTPNAGEAAGTTLGEKSYTGTKIIKGGVYTADPAASADGEGNRLQLEKCSLSGGGVVAENGGIISLKDSSMQGLVVARGEGVISTESTEIRGGAVSDGGTMHLNRGSIIMGADERLSVLNGGCILYGYGINVTGGSIYAHGNPNVMSTCHTFEKVGTVSVGSVKIEEVGTVVFEGAEKVEIAGDVSAIGCTGSNSVFVNFKSAPAVIGGNVYVKNGDLTVNRIRGGIEQIGETVTIHGDVHLEGCDIETLKPGNWVTSGGLAVFGQNSRLIIEGNVYCQGSCYIQIDSGGAIEIQGAIYPSGDTSITVDGENHEIESTAGMILASNKEDPLQPYVSKGVGYGS